MVGFTRRQLFAVLGLGSIVSCVFGGRVRAQDSQASQSRSTMKIEWRVPRVQVSTVRKHLKFEGKIHPDKETTGATKGLPLIYIIVGSVVVPYLADALLAVYRDIKYGGLVVVETEKGLKIHNDKRLDGSQIIVKDAKGVTIKKIETVADRKVLVEALTKLAR